MKIPNLKEIMKPVWAHVPGWGVRGKDVWYKIPKLEQGTTPKDPRLLKILEIRKEEKVLSVAGYYASWASALKNAGAEVDYSDVSQSIVNWVKKNVKTKFGKIICSGYEKIPKKPLEYDWTFTYEACGGGRGLPIAYLRSLLNKRGGILVIHNDKKYPEHIKANKSKIVTYSKIVMNLAKAYNIKYEIKNKIIKAIRRGEDKPKSNQFFIAKILTNDAARKKAELDLKVLENIKNKKVVGKELKESLKRLNIISKSHGDDMVREIELK